MVSKGTREEHFWRRVDTSGNCWVWHGCLNRRGYGRFYDCSKGRTLPAHRVAYEMTYGAISKGMLICHHCNNPRCVNPSHLYAGTAQEGEGVLTSKLAEDQVREIREKYLSTRASLRSLAKEYGVSHETIRLIVSNLAWKHVR